MIVKNVDSRTRGVERFKTRVPTNVIYAFKNP